MYITQALKRNVQLFPNKTATAYMDRSFTWKETLERVSKLAFSIKKLNVLEGDRVAILAHNSDRYFEFLYTVSWAGAVFVPINTRLAPPEIQFWINDSESKVIFVDKNFSEIVKTLSKENKIPTVKQIIYISDDTTPDGMIDYNSLISNDTTDDALKGYNDLAGLFYTGGTTGRSKGVMLSHTNMVIDALNCAVMANMNENARWLHAAPMFHIADCAGLFAISQVGGSHYFIPGFIPNLFFDAVSKYKITETILVPTMVNMAVHDPEIKNYDLNSLKKIMYGASPMPEPVIVKAMEILPNCAFYHAYGQTECAPLLTCSGPEAHVFEGPLAYKFKSCGKAVAGVELKIADDNGNEVPRGEVGEIYARGPNIMLGYWRQKELTDKAIENGWMKTGDGAKMDSDGYVFIVDRVKDMIISGGENIYSTEVENAIYQIKDVLECAVIGIPDPKWGEVVHAIIRVKDNKKIEEKLVIDHCHKNIAGFKCPKSVSFRNEPMPVSGAGKILKTTLRKPFWKGSDKQVN
jgi:long-chain acyl-CoA synthetase